jgi:predicted CoA-substrate-specific enzyme activase
MTDYFMGVDVGAATTKAILIDGNGNILASSVIPSGVDFIKAAEIVRDNVLGKANITIDQLKYIISTGYGRNNVTFANDNKTELSCHAHGAYHYFPESCLIVDIGGQDNKVIKIDSSGKQMSFKMNRKCAAGTGTFLEEIANRLGVPREKMNELAQGADKNLTLNSFCTVFASTEILARIREGESVENMVRGAFNSIVHRVIELGLSGATEENIVMTGGVVQYNPFIVKLLEEQLGTKIKVPPQPQVIGALGAALVANNIYNNEKV